VTSGDITEDAQKLPDSDLSEIRKALNAHGIFFKKAVQISTSNGSTCQRVI